MPTIGEVYNPIIAARHSPEEFERLLREAGKAIFQENPGKCPSEDHGYRAARSNIEYYVQYFGADIEDEVKALLGVSGTFMTLGGFRVQGQSEGEAAPSPIGPIA